MNHRTLADAVSRGTGNERSFLCPVHNDHSASASVNILKGLWYCYACGASGKVDGFSEPDIHDVHREIEGLLDFEQKIYPESWLDMFDSPKDPYWLSRFTPGALKHFRLGRDPVKDVPVYPLRDPQGRVLGVVSRSQGEGPKYRYPFGVRTSRLMFGYTEGVVATPVLVEGAMDAIAVWEAGYVGLACYGSRLYPEQVRLLSRLSPTRVILAFDEDRAGIAAREDAERLLGDIGISTVSLRWQDSVKDLAEMDCHTRKTLLQDVALLPTL